MVGLSVLCIGYGNAPGVRLTYREPHVPCGEASDFDHCEWLLFVMVEVSFFSIASNIAGASQF